MIFQAQREHGNKWAEIAKILPGRPDNVVKNHFYSTLRRQLRKVLRVIKGEGAKCPNEVSIGLMQKLMKENDIPYATLDNENVRELLVYVDEHPEKIDAVSEEKKKESSVSKYSL